VKLVYLVGFIMKKRERSYNYFNYNSDDAEDDNKHSLNWEKFK